MPGLPGSVESATTPSSLLLSPGRAAVSGCPPATTATTAAQTQKDMQRDIEMEIEARRKERRERGWVGNQACHVTRGSFIVP